MKKSKTRILFFRETNSEISTFSKIEKTSKSQNMKTVIHKYSLTINPKLLDQAEQADR
jgi:hypothetical protein